MKQLFKFAIFSVAIISLVCIAKPTPVYAQVDSNCVLTTVNHPAGPIPPGCESGYAQKAVDLARAQIGKIYVFDAPNINGCRCWSHYNPATGNTPNNFDCSGLTGWSYYWATGGKINMWGQTDSDWYGSMANYEKHGNSAAELANLRPGDLLYWEPGDVHHTAMYIGKSQATPAQLSGPNASLYCKANITDCFVEAYSTGRPVREISLSGQGGTLDRRFGSNGLIGYLRPIVK